MEGQVALKEEVVLDNVEDPILSLVDAVGLAEFKFLAYERLQVL